MNNIQNHIIKKTIKLLTLVLFFIFGCSRTSNDNSCTEETYEKIIRFNDFFIDQLIVSESYSNLIENYGEPDRVYNLLLKANKLSTNRKYDTIIFLVYQKKGVEYLYNNDSIQLYSINFEICNNNLIYLFGKQLNRNTTIKKFCKYYCVSRDYFTGVDANWTHYPDTNYGYQLLWVTDTINKECMEFYFDINKRLKYINFGCRNGGIL